MHDMTFDDGRFDAVYASPLACLALQWFTRVHHFTDVPITFASGAVVVDKAAFERIPAQHRDSVQRICRTRFRELVLATRKQNDEALVEIAKNGVGRVAVSAEELRSFQSVGKSVWQEQKGKLYTAELLDLVQRRDCAAGSSSSSR
jgi:TRAP-type C4-dicarboxylate transport system substrate-binding protein